MADPSTAPPLTRASVVAAHALVRPHVHRTPTLRCASLSAAASRRRDPGELAGTDWEFVGGPPMRELEPATDQTSTTAGDAKEKEGKGEGKERQKRTPANPKIRIWLKCENLQRVGAFKARGAFHALARLHQEPGWVEGGGRERGVVTHSSGGSLPFFPFVLSLSVLLVYVFFLVLLILFAILSILIAAWFIVIGTVPFSCSVVSSSVSFYGGYVTEVTWTAP